MKKIILALAASVGLCASVYAQDDAADNQVAEKNGSDLSFVSKNGHEVLPQAGDYCLGVGASSALQYFGDLFGLAGNNSAGAGAFNYANKGLPTAVVYGKYFVASDLAYRASVNVYMLTRDELTRVDDSRYLNADIKLDDKKTTQRGIVTLAVGLEKRRGHGRIQGIYGAEIFGSYNSGMRSTYEYANSITKYNLEVVGGNASTEEVSDLSRVIGTKGGSSFTAGARAFVGVEYFVAPKLSLGGEFTWGLSYENTGEKLSTLEYYDVESESVKQKTNITSSGAAEFKAGLNNIGGSVNLLFYF